MIDEENQRLAEHNKTLSRELDKITNQLFTAQEIATDLKNKLEEKKHSEQLGGWAIDRAIEMHKLYPLDKGTAQDVVDTAQLFCKWIMESSAVEKVTQKRSAS